MIKEKLVGTVQRLVAKNRFGVAFSIKLREQCNSIIGLSLSSGIEPTQNGELLLIDVVAPRSRYFVDVGANVGNWSLMFADRMTHAKGLAFEPGPQTVERLRAALRGAGFGGIEVVASAVSDLPGTLRFWEEAGYGETSSLLSQHSHPDAKAVAVPVTTLDIEMQTRGVERIDFLKIDAEGFDLNVLRGAAGYLGGQRIRVLQFEYNAPWALAGGTIQAAFRLLEGNGYKVRLLMRDGLFIVNPAMAGEYFRYGNYVAYCPCECGELLEAGARPFDALFA
ncbi:FkbM family methyltransferase [Aquabacter spiritensis]|uniref:FkbM family methyltransferase n=1 Tax=Aquabacter spiritensis TaxID=933073 RepID=A0A4R3LVJ2_9HYPH|nr:FkbM family methyltransferase [Aquabacter spiritensis]TCT04601.1 FkbM family methyltransferase [Aquabacter spiritensis]